MRETVALIEHITTHIINESYPNEWDEDFISFRLMQDLRKLFNNRVIQFTDFSKIVSWKSFKNNGAQETSYGDIALIVNIQFSSGETLKGVACIEAKRSFPSHNFESIGLPQLQRIHANAPYSHLLLYTHTMARLPIKFPSEATWPSYFWISPLNTANKIIEQIPTNENCKLLRTSFPFSMFLTSRIFWGHDLDYRTKLYDDIAKGMARREVKPKYLGIINVYYDKQQPIEVQLSEEWSEINDDSKFDTK